MTEKESSYCESVLDALENPNYQNSAFNHEKSTRTDGNHTEKAPTSKAQRLQIVDVNLPQMQQCTMEGSEEVGCEGCSIRFYHNGIDRDDIFDPTKNGDVST